MSGIRLGGDEAALNVLGVNDLLAASVLVAVRLADPSGLESEVGRQQASAPSAVQRLGNILRLLLQSR